MRGAISTCPSPTGGCPRDPDFKRKFTGGLEIGPQRHRTVIANFKDTGLSSFIDARLGDVHIILPAPLAGPFDFVFSDADKGWDKNHFVAVWPKVLAGRVCESAAKR